MSESVLLLCVAKSALSKISQLTRLNSSDEDFPLARLAKSLTQICDLIAATNQRHIKSDIIYDVDDMLDSFITDARQKQDANNKDSMLQHLKTSFSLSNLLFIQRVKNLCQKLEHVIATAKGLGIQSEGSAAENTECEFGYHSKRKLDMVFGRDGDKNAVIKCLSDSIARDVNQSCMFAIWGVPGVGKTTLAELVYYDHWVCANFDFKLWISGASSFKDKRGMMECIVDTIYNYKSLHLISLERLERMFIDAICNKKYFIVLDDVEFYVNVWSDLIDLLNKYTGRGNVILFTTKSGTVASRLATLPTYELQALSNDVCWSLLSQLVFDGSEREKHPKLMKIGIAMIGSCHGLPLNVKLLAGMLRNNDDEGMLRNNDDEKERSRISTTLEPSPLVWVCEAYRKLPCHLRACVAYSRMFFRNTGIYSSHLINYWRAEGLLHHQLSSGKGEEVGYKCFGELLMRSFIQDSANQFNCAAHVKMHDFSMHLHIDAGISMVYDQNSRISNATKHVLWCNEKETLFSNISHLKRLRTLKFDSRHISTSLLERVISKFRKLRVLDVSNCNLTELPYSVKELKHLRLLNLSGNRAIQGLPSTICKLCNLQTLNLDGCEQLEKLPGGIQKLLNLRYFSITTKQSTFSNNELNELSSLEHLELFSCLSLTSLWANDQHLTSLKKLFIYNCPNLVWLPNSMNYLVHLEELGIHNCPELDLMERISLYGLKSLLLLEFVGIPKLVEFPSVLSSATTLQHFLISDCLNLISLWRSRPNLTSLQTLCIYNCPRLLMRLHDICSLTALQSLDIRRCFCLSRAFSRSAGYGWRLISCIPQVIVNGRLLRFEGSSSTKSSLSTIHKPYLPRRLSYFSAKLTSMQLIYSQGREMREDGFLGPIHQSRWELLSLAFKTIVRLRTIVKAKNISQDSISFGQQTLPTKSRRWRSLSHVHGAIVRMRTLAKENHKSQPSMLSDAQLEMMLHCCLFDGSYEFEKDKLVQLWIAAKLLQNEPLEDNGRSFFDYLVENNYIVLSRDNNLAQMRMYKANLPQFYATFSLIPRFTEYKMRVEDGNMTANRVADSWHISVLSGTADQTTFEIIRTYGNLSTLIFLRSSLIKQVPSELFLSLKLLTTLDLSGSSIVELPNSIGYAKFMCYLDLSRTPIERLPRSISCLQKLQTLRLKSCVHLFELPKGITALMNLRHLAFDILGQLISMPRGIGALVQLRTLPAFLVGFEESCNIGELKHMNNLTGKLCISGLEHVPSFEDAKEACLTNKESLKELELRWSDNVQFHEREEQCLNGVLECLKPSFSLEELRIVCFPGSLLPSWISDPQYTNLVSISLLSCENCHTLPSLGQLHKLKNLDIVEMNSVKIIDEKFCGVNLYQEAFPMLETLAIDGMSSLKEWMGIIYGECSRLVKLTIKRCPQLRVVHSFPNLRLLKHLEVTYCPLLESLPKEMLSSPIDTIVIGSCPVLNRRYSKGGEDSNKIRHVPNVWIDSEDTQSEDEDDSLDDDAVGGISSPNEVHSSDEVVVKIASP